MIGLDTNVVVRYLAQDDRAQSALATRLIEGSLTAAAPGFISLIVLVEVVWVLESCYDCSRKELLDILERLLRVKQLAVEEPESVWQALREFRSGQAEFADCIIERVANRHGCERTMTFDKAAARIPGMELVSI